MTAITLCTLQDAEVILPLVAKLHDEIGIPSSAMSRRSAVLPLLEGSSFGAVWLFGPRKAPVGYMVVSFSWSVRAGGMDATLDEIYVRPSVRGRGIAHDALRLLALSLRDAGIRVLHTEVSRDTSEQHRLYLKSGFKLRDEAAPMSQSL